MRLIYPEYRIEVEFQENIVQTLSIESPKVFSKIMADLWNQVNGGEGGFILAEEDKAHHISKEVELVMNPFSLNCNDRKIITRLYQEITGLATDDFYEKTSALNGKIVDYLDELINAVPYHLKFNLDMDVSALLKIYGVEIESGTDSLLEQVVDYIRVMHQICKINIFIMVNIKQYFEADELQSLYEYVFYEKVNLLLVEGTYSVRAEHEKGLILDKDLCIINID
jgi:CRISPR type II-A-associated protein Csn2